MPGAAGGFLLGSIIINKLSLTTGQQLRTIFFVAIFGLLTLIVFVIQCDTAPLADLPSHDYSQTANM